MFREPVESAVDRSIPWDAGPSQGPEVANAADRDDAGTANLSHPPPGLPAMNTVSRFLPIMALAAIGIAFLVSHRQCYMQRVPRIPGLAGRRTT
jgi:hypothetical protein